MINAIRIGEVRIPMTAKSMLMTPALYSLLRHASVPIIKAIGLNNGDNMNIPMNPKIMPNVP